MFYPMFLYPSMIILLPGLILAAYAQFKVKTTYNKYLKVANQRGITGAETASRILKKNGIYDVTVEQVGGKLSDHYDPTKKKLRLSNEVYNGRSIASIAIAAHEVGHAIQHNKSYAPLTLRSTIAPVVGFTSNSAWFLFFIGILFNFPQLMTLGILFFASAVIFNIVTLPVEFNASSRALTQLESEYLVYDDEGIGVKKVLNAAALTYVAATIVAFLQLLRMVLLRGSRD
ncbi:peptidase [Alkalibaculum sp. M08DMB]|uniref:Peptidase n=1 Tax=Alkalibaculum sporogenes TaxID=2655001 RepID=A0A6A7K9G2_9FIRM|nr:zinc metallopeptidase [Alkalibaculum sporogenes]MPW26032.1 peptidase [Alkalibaculum sporogenes]